MKNYKFPDSIILALSILEKAGYEAVVVGGAIRDFFLNKKPHDYDIATNASIESMYDLFKEYKIIETGIKHGTLTIHINHMEIEVTTYRGKTNTLKEDLSLRDFTINSMAMDMNYKLYDYFNGNKDLENKIVRANTKDTFVNDPLTILRAIRISGKYNFIIEENTNKLMNENISLLSKVSKERISSEFSQILILQANSLIKNNIAIFKEFIHELKTMIGFNQNNHYHIYNVFEHTLKVVENTSPILELRLAGLFHDIGKPSTYTEDDNKIGHFHGHESVSYQIATNILKRLKYDNKTIDIVTKLIKFHDYKLTND